MVVRNGSATGTLSTHFHAALESSIAINLAKPLPRVAGPKASRARLLRCNVLGPDGMEHPSTKRAGQTQSIILPFEVSAHIDLTYMRTASSAFSFTTLSVNEICHMPPSNTATTIHTEVLRD
ncbi:hypothetical protein Q7P37_010608 [Cladosporium fusiforme]